ncbi:uncharacterized protein EHS24_006891 [Apiotrichum porosum]|uniref:Uncharacterized protein n=1 Tax=Apiotrichum porosum TaxID=105984 RepID=A0A427XWJ6_9TREE|nr:uncharacterized protein EHS24_006891 [Apiotrichum porosum]RSH83224.1 hypothetical protein EHS24_006891 [Apiotrichum porosum]
MNGSGWYPYGYNTPAAPMMSNTQYVVLPRYNPSHPFMLVHEQCRQPVHDSNEQAAHAAAWYQHQPAQI